MHHNIIQLYTNNTLTLVCCCQHTENHKTSKKHVITNIQNKVKPGVHPSKGLQRHDKQEGMEKIQKETYASK